MLAAWTWTLQAPRQTPRQTSPLGNMKADRWEDRPIAAMMRFSAQFQLKPEARKHFQKQAKGPSL